MAKTGHLSFLALWREIPAIAKVMMPGILLICLYVVGDFIRLLQEPGPLKPGEDLYVHLALLVLVPASFIAMTGLSFGYAYYQLCKRSGRKPFWKNL
jgi:hypothetical protein